MILHVDQLVILGMLCSSLHWLVARSKIMQPLWSRARGMLDQLLRCPACSGFWLAIGAAIVGVRPADFYEQEPTYWWTAAIIATTGLFGVFLTPVFEGVLLWGLRESALDDEPETEVAAEQRAPLTESGETPTPIDRPTARL